MLLLIHKFLHPTTLVIDKKCCTHSCTLMSCLHTHNFTHTVCTRPSLYDEFEEMQEKKRRLLLGKLRTREKAVGRSISVFHLHSQKFTSLYPVLFYLFKEFRKSYKKIKKIRFIKCTLKMIFLTFKWSTLSPQP